MWFGLGKPRSKFGRWLDKRKITQKELAEESGVSRGTISRLAQNDGFEPTMRTAKKIIKALRKEWGCDVDYDDFWG